MGFRYGHPASTTFAIILGLGLASCEGGGPAGPSSPRFVLSATDISFADQNNQRVVTISNLSDDPIDWRVLSSTASWLTAWPTSGALEGGASGTLSIRVDRVAVSHGTHSASLQIGASGQSALINVSVQEALAPPAVASLQPSIVTLGSLDASEVVEVVNTGGSPLTWSLIGPSWATLTPSSGSLGPGLRTQVLVTPNRVGLTNGQYLGNLQLSSNGGSRVATLQLDVSGSVGIGLDPASLDFGTSTTQLLLRVRNDSDQSIQWAATPGASWLAVSPSTGTLPPRMNQLLSVNVSRAEMSPGHNEATIDFASSRGKAVATVAAELGLAPDPMPSPPPPPPSDPGGSSPPSINLSPTLLDFGANNTELSLVIQNTGGAPLDWQAVPAHNYLAVSPASGRLNAEGSATLRVLAARSNLTAAGRYQSSIQFTSNGGNRTIPVALQVESGSPPPPPGDGSLSEIDATGAKDVTDQLNAYIASVPDGSVIQFPDGARYRVEGILRLIYRNNLTIEGNGALVFANTDGSGVIPPEGFSHLWPRQRSHIMITGGSSIVVRDLAVRGANPSAGSAEGAYVVSLEGQHGFDVNGVAGLTLENVTVTDTYGDFLYLSRDISKTSTGLWSQNIVVRNSHFERSGRQGVAIVGAADVLIETTYIGEVGRTIIDIEPLGSSAGAHRITFQYNTFGPSRHLLLSSGGVGPNVMDIALIGNQLVGMELKVRAVSADGSRRSGYRIIDNTSDARLGSPVPAMRFHYADGIEVRGNYQLMSESRDMTGVYACASTDIDVGGNDFPGALKEVEIESVCPTKSSE